MGGLVLGGLFIRCVFIDEGMNEFVEGCFLLMCLTKKHMSSRSGGSSIFF